MCSARFFSILAALAPLVGAGLARAQDASTYPAYVPGTMVDGTIRIWGHGSRDDNYAGALVTAWQEGFRRHQPQVEFQATMRGSSTGIGGLYTGVADLALMERVPIMIEMDAWLPIFKSPPLQVTVATGSLDVPHHDPAPVVFVHRDNPLTQLTLAQLDAVLGADHRRGPGNIRTWGELGLTGAWAKRSIHLYLPAIASDDGQFIEQAVMGGSQKWNGELREFPAQPDQPDPGQRILAAAAADPEALAIATLVYRNAGVKPVALSAAAAPYVLPSRTSVADRSYPLTRSVNMVLSRASGVTLTPRLKEYLDYLLSEEGQAAVARDGQYFPLPPGVAQEERNKLK